MITYHYVFRNCKYFKFAFNSPPIHNLERNRLTNKTDVGVNGDL